MLISNETKAMVLQGLSNLRKFNEKHPDPRFPAGTVEAVDAVVDELTEFDWSKDGVGPEAKTAVYDIVEKNFVIINKPGGLCGAHKSECEWCSAMKECVMTAIRELESAWDLPAFRSRQ